MRNDIAIADCGNGRVMVSLTISDEGRLRPIDHIEPLVPGRDNTGQPELWLSLAIHLADGKQTTSAELMRDIAQRAQLLLVTTHVDGKNTGEAREFSIPVADYLKPAGAEK